MKLSCFFLGMFTAIASFAQQQGTPQGAVITQTRSGPTANATSVGTGSTTTTGMGATQVSGVTSATGASATGTTVGTPVTGVITQTGGTVGAVDTTGAATIVPQNNVDIFGRVVPPATSAGTVDTTGAATLIPQNNVDIFGRIVGVAPSAQTVTEGTSTVGNGAAGTIGVGGGTGTAVGTVAQQVAQGVGAPGFTQIMITLQGTVQSEADRQAILNRFQGLSGFVVVDQIHIAGQNGQSVNEAAGAATGTQP